MLQAQFLHPDESSLSTAEKSGTPKREEKQYHEYAVNVHR